VLAYSFTNPALNSTAQKCVADPGAMHLDVFKDHLTVEQYLLFAMETRKAGLQDVQGSDTGNASKKAQGSDTGNASIMTLADFKGISTNVPFVFPINMLVNTMPAYGFKVFDLESKHFINLQFDKNNSRLLLESYYFYLEFINNSFYCNQLTGATVLEKDIKALAQNDGLKPHLLQVVNINFVPFYKQKVINTKLIQSLQLLQEVYWCQTSTDPSNCGTIKVLRTKETHS
jgi:hypothetical protein